jgi:hypothetical protein
MMLRTIAFASVAVLWTAPSDARTLFVAGGGTGAVPCTAAAPCSSLGTALNGAGAGDVIVCLSSPDRTAFSITKSITIDCGGARAPVGDGGFTGSGGANVGIIINIAVSSADPFRTVRLRGLTIDGGALSGGHLYDRGIEIQSATAVYIEDCVISNVNQQGIYDHRTGGQTKLFIKNTIVSGGGGAGIALGSQGPNTNVLDDVSAEYNAYGIAAATGNNVLINRSVFSGNSVAGIEGDSGAQIAVNNSTISHNSTGVQSNGSVRLSNNDIAFNSFAISGSSGTFGNNRFSGNSSIGTAPTAIGGATSDLGQQ